MRALGVVRRPSVKGRLQVEAVLFRYIRKSVSAVQSGRQALLYDRSTHRAKTSSAGTSLGCRPAYRPPCAAMTFSPPMALRRRTRWTNENLWPSWCSEFGVVFETGCSSVGCVKVVPR